MPDLLLWILGTVASTTLAYRLLPFREPGARRPAFAPFPKYRLSFSGDAERVALNLQAMGFEADEGRPNRFARGRLAADFSARSMLLHASIDIARSRIEVSAPYLGILFDTGDLWQITIDAAGKGQG